MALKMVFTGVKFHPTYRLPHFTPFITGVFSQAHLVLNQQIKLNQLFLIKDNDESHEIRIRNQTSPTKQIQIIHLPQKNHET